MFSDNFPPRTYVNTGKSIEEKFVLLSLEFPRSYIPHIGLLGLLWPLLPDNLLLFIISLLHLPTTTMGASPFQGTSFSSHIMYQEKVKNKQLIMHAHNEGD